MQIYRLIHPTLPQLKAQKKEHGVIEAVASVQLLSWNRDLC